MNRTITSPVYDVAFKQSRSRHQPSLASRILDRLRDWLKSSRRGFEEPTRYPTFIEANRLDGTVGPEIKRTLRI